MPAAPTSSATPPAAPHPHAHLISILLPIGSDSALMERELRAIAAALRSTPHEILAIYDNSSNLTALDAMQNRPHSLRLVKGLPGGKDLQAGIRAAAGDVLITLNEDEPDPYLMIPQMAAKIRTEDCAVVVAGRREPPRLRRWILWCLAGMNARDLTTMFRAYDANFLDRQTIQSATRSAVPFELTVKAHQLGLHIEELRVPRSAGVKMERDALRPCMHWLALLLQAPILVWSIWLLMIAVLLTHALTVGAGDTFGHVDNVAILAAGAFALTLAVRRVRVRTRFADAFFSLVLLNPLLYSAKTLPYDKTLIATGLLALMTGAIVAMKRDHLLRYFAVTALAISLTAISESFIMLLPALVAWLIGAGYLVAKTPGPDAAHNTSRNRGFAMMAAGEVALVLFGLACIFEQPTHSPPAASLFASIASFIDFPLLVLAIVMLALGWRKGPTPHHTVPPHFAGMLALLVGLLTMLLNNFQEGALTQPGTDQTVLLLCLLYIVSALHGPRRLQWLIPPLLLICAAVYTLFR